MFRPVEQMLESSYVKVVLPSRTDTRSTQQHLMAAPMERSKGELIYHKNTVIQIG